MVVAPPTPTWLMNKTLSITNYPVVQEATGSPETTTAQTPDDVWRCMFQPASTREALEYQRQTGTTVYDVWCELTGSEGTSITSLKQNGIVTIDSVAYRMIGLPLDPCSLGTVAHLIVERNT